MNAGKVAIGTIAGLLIGGAIGALFGVLFAPEKGSVTRRRISLEGGYYNDDIHEKLDTLAENINKRFNHLTGRSSELADSVESKARDIKNA